MKSFSVFAGLSLLASQASAHYIFQQLTHGGTLYPVYTYVRTNTNMNSPVTDLTSNDLRCNAGGETSATGGTTTLTVKAGDKFSITSDVTVYHNGPFSIYMAKAPGAAADFDGSGQVWFKIYDLGPTFAAGTVTWPLYQTYSYTIPSDLPSGDYLLRFQQLGIHNPYPGGTPQFYISCAQITVTGGGSGVPGPLVSIPGFIKGDEPGYTANIYNQFTSYEVPGPAVWTGGVVGGGGGGSPATTAKPATTSAIKTTAAPTTMKTTSTVRTSATAAPTGATVAKYGQCGGTGWTGGTVCAAGSKCTVSNQYFSQCL